MEKSKMNYIIIVDDYIDGLQSRVNEQLRDGYSLVGGVAVDKINRFCQAMIKITKEKKNVKES